MNVADLAIARKRGPYYTEGNGPSRYLLRLPGDDKAKGRTRATTFVKSIEDDSALKPWLSTMAIVGTLKSTRVRANWSALLTRHPDPWYAGDESKDECRRLVEEAQEAGGSGERRDTGTALHDILESIVTGLAPITDVPDEWRPHVEAALALLDAEGLEPVPELCEQSVLNRRYGTDIVGRFDLILRRKATGRLHIGDWKTGGATWRSQKDWKTKQHKSWVDGYTLSDLGHATQMAVYATAEEMILWPESKWDTCELVPMPELDQDEAIIIHLPSTESANCSARYLDLSIGREALEVCATVRKIRNAKPLLRRVGAVSPDAAPAPEPSVPVDLRAELVARLKALVTLHPEAREVVARHWPTDVPTFKAGEHTAEQLNQISKVLTYVENEHDMPFVVPPVGSEPPAHPAPTPRTAVVEWVAPLEGDPINAEQYEAVRTMCAGAPEILNLWHVEAVAAGRPFSLRDSRTTRRAEIVIAALEVGRHLYDETSDEMIDAALRAVADIERQAGMTVGAALGSLTIDEARRLGELARAFGAGEVQPTTDEHGAFRFAA